jgi:mannose-6-phosphate isomerase
MNEQLRALTTSPMTLAPNRVWRMYRGGAMIDRLKSVVDPRDSEFPEEWVGSTVQASNPGTHYRDGEGLALVAANLPAPVSLKHIIEQFPEQILGAQHVNTHGTSSALLVKLLDAAERLIIHAHPTKAFAKEHLNSCFGKTEAWFVLETRPEVEDPYVLIAFKEEVSRNRYREMLDMQTVNDMIGVMHKVSVKAGDVVYVKAGLPHAIGEGIFMVELQEPTDYSVILERTCALYTFSEEESFLGLPKEITLSNLDHRVYTPDEVQKELVIRPRVLRREGESTESQLLGYETTECFAGHRLDVVGELGDSTQGRYSVLIVLDGEGSLIHSHGELKLKRGTEVFVPASVGQHVFRSTKRLSVFKCLPAQAK